MLVARCKFASFVPKRPVESSLSMFKSKTCAVLLKVYCKYNSVKQLNRRFSFRCL